MKHFLLLMLALIIFPFAVFSQNNEHLTDDFLNFIMKKDYEAAHQLFTEDVALQVHGKRLKDLIDEREKIYGEISIRSKVICTSYDSHTIIYRFLWFGNQGFRFYFQIEGNKISGFYIQKESVLNQYQLPPYADTANTEIRTLLIPSAHYFISAEMMLPKTTENYPMVVFVHGSSANDRDEGVFGNRPFRDLAYGLAANGIANLRFDKNTYLFGGYLAKNKEFNVWDESGTDVLSIVNYLNIEENISKDRIILLGHSLGAMLTPRILDSLELAGGIMIAGNARPLQDVYYEQMEFFAKQDGDFSEGDKQRMNILKQQNKHLELLKTENPKDFKEALPLGLNAWYWKDLLNYNAVETLEKINEPILLLQGKGDYQVSMKDYKLFKKALKKRKRPFKAKAYPKVNHLLFENKEKPSPKEYQRNANVEPYIINDMVEWIKSL